MANPEGFGTVRYKGKIDPSRSVLTKDIKAEMMKDKKMQAMKKKVKLMRKK